jgi:ribosomal 50S subunit-recycling heat shock protein
MFENLFKKRAMAKEEIRERERTEEHIEFLKSMQTLDVKDGDVIILRYPGILSKSSINNLKDTVRCINKINQLKGDQNGRSTRTSKIRFSTENIEAGGANSDRTGSFEECDPQGL